MPGSPRAPRAARLSGQGVRESAQDQPPSSPPSIRYCARRVLRVSLTSTLGAFGCRRYDGAQLPGCCLGRGDAAGTGAGPVRGELSAARFALGVAGDAAGWSAPGSTRSLFPSWDLGALLVPSCPARGRDPLSCWACGAEASPAAGAEVGCFPPRPCWCAAVQAAAAALVRTAWCSGQVVAGVWSSSPQRA